jgi:hypothetical protein
MPRCSRSFSMSATRSQVVLSTRSACGVLRPEPRWSNSTMRYFAGSWKRRILALQPAPGPPCSNTTGLPSGLPHCSQYRVWRPSTFEGAGPVRGDLGIQRAHGGIRRWRTDPDSSWRGSGPAPQGHAVAALEVGLGRHVDEAGRGHQRAHGLALVPAVLQQQPAPRAPGAPGRRGRCGGSRPVRRCPRRARRAVRSAGRPGRGADRRARCTADCWRSGRSARPERLAPVAATEPTHCRCRCVARWPPPPPSAALLASVACR